MIINCPNCSSAIKNPKQTLITCQYCDSSFMLEAHSLKQDSLIEMNKTFYIQSQSFIAIKQQKQPHDNGVRVDYLVQNKQKELYWLMIEDEDIALVKTTQSKLDEKSGEKLNWHTLLPNSQIKLLEKHWLVTQKRALQNKNKQSYLSNQAAELVILSFENNSIYYQQGRWLDAFEIDSKTQVHHED